MSAKELNAKVKEYKEIQQFIKQLEDEAENLKAAITAEMEARVMDIAQRAAAQYGFTIQPSADINNASRAI